MRAVGFYHSQTPELAEPYRQQVQAALGSGGGAMPSQFTQVASFAPVASVVPAMPSGSMGGQTFRQAAGPGAVGRGLAADRAAPILLVTRGAPQPVSPRRIGPPVGY
jgi:hypothetical protein